MKRKYFHSKYDNSIYYVGKDQKNQDNLINIRTGSEYFIPGHYYDEQEKIQENFYEITRQRALTEVPEPYGYHSIN